MKRILMALFMVFALAGIPNICVKAADADYNVRIEQMQVGPDIKRTEFTYHIELKDQNGTPRTLAENPQGNFTMRRSTLYHDFAIPVGWTYTITQDFYASENIKTRIMQDRKLIEGVIVTGTVTDSKQISIQFIQELSPKPLLPETGSCSRYLFLIGGTVLFFGSMFIMVKRKKF